MTTNWKYIYLWCSKDLLVLAG